MSLYLFKYRQVVSDSDARMPNCKYVLGQQGFCPAVAQSYERSGGYRGAKDLNQAPACALVRNWATPF